MEVWKDIPGYEGKYQVSNLGRVKSLNYNRQRIEKNLRIYVSEDGYARIYLSKESKKKDYLLHRIVADAFVPNPHNKSEINHINGVKSDNRAENLEWCSRSENEKHAWVSGLGTHYLRQVVQYDMQRNPLKEWESIKTAGNETGIERRNINACCQGKRKTAGGYIWRYKEAE